jgi:uncharacterized RDD family membrane protein YckC
MEEVSKVNRLIALIIDSVVAYLPVLVLAFAAGATGINALVYVGYLVYLAYMLLRDALMGGQSIGKKVMKYAAVKADGTSLSGDFAASATRNVSLVVPILNLVEGIFVVTDKPRLGDGWAGTKVVNKA